MDRTEILQAAEVCVTGQRVQDYGTPENNFDYIAKLWSVYLGIEIKPEDVPKMMILFKIARTRNGINTDDSYIDMAGYAACAGEIAGGKK